MNNLHKDDNAGNTTKVVANVDKAVTNNETDDRDEDNQVGDKEKEEEEEEDLGIVGSSKKRKLSKLSNSPHGCSLSVRRGKIVKQFAEMIKQTVDIGLNYKAAEISMQKEKNQLLKSTYELQEQDYHHKERKYNLRYMAEKRKEQIKMFDLEMKQIERFITCVLN